MKSYFKIPSTILDAYLSFIMNGDMMLSASKSVWMEIKYAIYNSKGGHMNLNYDQVNKQINGKGSKLL